MNTKTELNLNGKSFRKTMSLLMLENICNRDLEKIAWSNCEIQASSIQILKSILATNSRLKDLNISKNDITDNDLSNLIDGLIESNCSLLVLDVSWNLFGIAGGIVLGNYLSEKRSLIDLNLSGNKLGNDGLDKIIFHMKNIDSIEKLGFSTCSLGPEFSDTLFEFISQSTSLKVISISSNKFSSTSITKFWTCIAACTSILDIKASNINFKDEGLANILNHENFGASIISLDLSSNKIGNKDLLVLTSIIPNLVNLKSLSLLKNDFSSSGASIFFKILSTSKCRLEHLNMSHNLIELEGSISLAALLKGNSTIKELLLNNCRIGSEGAIFISRALSKNYTLCSLYLASNIIGLGALSIAEVLKTSNTLKILSLNGNKLTSVVAASLSESLNSNSSLESLYVLENFSELGHNVDTFKLLHSFLQSGTLKTLDIQIDYKLYLEEEVKVLNSIYALSKFKSLEPILKSSKAINILKKIKINK